MFRKRYRKQIPELNTTSTADISFMLLIFFLDAKDQLTCDDKAVTLDELGEAVTALASVNRTGHVVSVQADANTSYEAYFKMQNTIVGAYQALREQYAQQHYGKHYQRCTSEERQTINDYYPLRISENMEEGGRP